MDVTANCPNCDEAVMVVDPEEGDEIDCPECAAELTVESVDLAAVPATMVLVEFDADADEEDEEEDEDDEDFDDEEEDDEFDDDDDESDEDDED